MSSFITNSYSNSAIYGLSSAQTVAITSHVGTNIGIEQKKGHGVSPSLFFRFVKSKLQRNEQDALRKKLKKLQQIVNSSEELGQIALHEKLMESIAVTVRELECASVGVDRWVSDSVIQKFHKVYKPEGEKILRFDVWEKFPRTPPRDVAANIKRIKDLNLFDEYHILYLDYTGEKLKTNKEKIKEKDPILFGKFAYAPDRYYFIADWIDDYCDLTFDKFVTAVSGDEVVEQKLPELSPEYFAKVKQEVMDRHERLKKTNSSNWQTLASEEDKKKVESVVLKKSWWKFWS